MDAYGCLWIVATIVVHNVSGDYKCFIALKTLALQMDDYGWNMLKRCSPYP